jgi:hypothetical protein
MCTLVVLRRPGHRWPLLLAANRDEMADRPWQPPARHWPDAPGVVAGRDLLGGGSWFGINDDGVAAAVLNRINTLGPAPGRRSRGELPLRALACATAREAAEAVGGVDPGAWRSFNMVIADRRETFYVRSVNECVRAEDGSFDTGSGSASLSVEPVPEGLSMVTAYDRNDLNSPRIRRYLPRFATAAVPRPEAGDWAAWIALLGSRDADADAGPGGAMTVATPTGFGTVCSALLALPAADSDRPRLQFAAGPPDSAPFEPIAVW